MRRIALVGLLMALTAPVAASNNIALSGDFRYQPSSMEGEQICFYPNAQGEQEILRAIKMTEDSYGHTVWFCFNDTEAAADQLGLSLKLPPSACGFEGKASVTVSGYLPNLEEGDNNDLAKLGSVQKRNAVQAITECEEDLFGP